jgi:signal peptidase I
MRSRRRIALIAALALFGYAGLRGKLRRYEIAERSMEPTLSPGDYVIARALEATPGRGQMIIFAHPGLSNFELVKRVVGLPGEHVVIRNGQVHADDAVLAEPWANGPTRPDGEWQLGRNEVFVLGDNRAASSADSRTLGPVQVGHAGWRLVARYWPLRSAGRITI